MVDSSGRDEDGIVRGRGKPDSQAPFSLLFPRSHSPVRGNILEILSLNYFSLLGLVCLFLFVLFVELLPSAGDFITKLKLSQQFVIHFLLQDHRTTGSQHSHSDCEQSVRVRHLCRS